ncbi:MAG: L-2-amino-thiazoline-4-carboxylic acid hydrolase [Bacteroidetes bacterium]|nr:L-2-amino-thiazoline-4-carboxylic acid hydrolase [Bacteroidota bacterium]
MAKKYIVKKWGKEFYYAYKKAAKQKLREIESELPPRVDNFFQTDYKSIVACIPIYFALMKQGIPRNEIDMVIWKTIERVYNLVPPKGGKKSYRKILDGLKAYQKKGEMGLLAKSDWVLKVEEEESGSYFCRVTECGAYKILINKGYDFIFPCMCRVDHLTMNLRGFRYERDKTIADGGDLCNNHFMGLGYTEWAPENGFSTRK